MLPDWISTVNKSLHLCTDSIKINQILLPYLFPSDFLVINLSISSGRSKSPHHHQINFLLEKLSWELEFLFVSKTLIKLFRIQKRCNTGSISGCPTKIINSRLLIYKNLTNPFICRIFLLFINYTILSICNDILMVLNDNAF